MQPTEPPEKESREAWLVQIKQQIVEGTYVSSFKLKVAVERMMESDLSPSLKQEKRTEF